MHAHQISFAKCQYQSRALSASPPPPPIPPQPEFIQYKKPVPSFDVPPPPPSRCYQLIPIGDTIINQRISQQQSPSPLIHHSVERRSFNRNNNNYENIPVKPAFVVKDPRRKPYYYNELSQSLDVDLVDEQQDSNAKSNATKFELVEHILNDEIEQNSAIRENSATNYGSGGSLDHIF